MLFILIGIKAENLNDLIAIINLTLQLTLLISLGMAFLFSLPLAFDDTKEKLRLREKFKICIKFYNPIMIYLYYPAKGIAWSAPRIPAGAMILYNFLKNLFFLIHSDLRLLCGVDSLIGAVTGYFTGNALIGALAGGMLGIADYEIISKRYLKVELKP